MKFGIDLDGVLADFTSAVIVVANRLWPNKLPIGYVPVDWNYKGVLTEQEWDMVWAELMRTENLWLNLPSLVGVAQLQVFLAYHPEANIHFITSRCDTKGLSAIVQCTSWLEQRRLWPRFDRSLVTPVQHASEKIDIIKNTKLPFFLDDYGPTVESLQGITKAYLLDAPYNQKYDLPRVSSVAEYLYEIEKSENANNRTII